MQLVCKRRHTAFVVANGGRELLRKGDDPQAEKPVVWLRFLSDLLYPENIPTFQEYIGYCLIPSTKGQRMMILKGEGGEGKSQIGPVLARLFGCNMKDGSIAKISDNRFARADLEHIRLLVDDDMKMEALKQTNYVKSMTMQEVVDLLRDEHGWSDSVSNLSNKLQRESLRYVEAVQLADVLGYEIVWQRKKS